MLPAWIKYSAIILALPGTKSTAQRDPCVAKAQQREHGQHQQPANGCKSGVNILITVGT